MTKMYNIRRSLALSLAVLSGCHSFGPDQLRGTHPLYNAAIVDSINGQFLSNLVRLHYRDPTFFLDVASVAATVRLGMNGDAGQISMLRSPAISALGAVTRFTLRSVTLHCRVRISSRVYCRRCRSTRCWR